MEQTKWTGPLEFKRKVIEVADQIGVNVRVIYMREMRNKWASITSDGKRLTFDSGLLNHDKEIGEYVIVHELLHLRVPNHGKLFKSLMRLYVKEPEVLENRLKTLVSPNP